MTRIKYWEQNHNLRLNKAKSAELIFTNCKRQQTEGLPAQIPDIRHVTSIKTLGVTMMNQLSTREHICDVICKCAQLLHAFKLLSHHGMSNDSTEKAIIIYKLLYASPAWRGFTSIGQ